MKVGVLACPLMACALVAGTPAMASGAASGRVRAGRDVSFPQCDRRLPAGQAFGIVAVNDGRPNTTNPCLAAELNWARASAGGTRQPKVSLYVNTADPGNRRGVTDWPKNNTDPITGRRVRDPYGTCRGRNGQACAWQYGWDMAELDARTRGISRPGRYRWWLDVELANTWQRNRQDNRADLEGMADYFRRIRAAVGLYSTAWQWDHIAGTVPAGSPLDRLPDWIPGAGTLAQARRDCALAPLTWRGRVSLTQRRTPPVSSDYSCGLGAGHGGASSAC